MPLEAKIVRGTVPGYSYAPSSDEAQSLSTVLPLSYSYIAIGHVFTSTTRMFAYSLYIASRLPSIVLYSYRLAYYRSVRYCGDCRHSETYNNLLSVNVSYLPVPCASTVLSTCSKVTVESTLRTVSGIVHFSRLALKAYIKKHENMIDAVIAITVFASMSTPFV